MPVQPRNGTRRALGSGAAQAPLVSCQAPAHRVDFPAPLAGGEGGGRKHRRPKVWNLLLGPEPTGWRAEPWGVAAVGTGPPAGCPGRSCPAAGRRAALPPRGWTPPGRKLAPSPRWTFPTRSLEPSLLAPVLCQPLPGAPWRSRRHHRRAPCGLLLAQVCFYGNLHDFFFQIR